MKNNDRMISQLGLLLLFIAIMVGGGWVAFSSPFPWVFSDEHYYSWLAKYRGDMAGAAHVGLVSTVPKFFLYFWVYSSAFFSDSGFYSLNKLINLVFWGGAGVAGYFAAIRFLEKPLAIFFSVVVLLSPWVIYTRIFSPEIMYYSVFWASVAVIVWCWSPDRPATDLIVGALIGALALVKSHAVFLIPGLLVGCALARLYLYGVSRKSVLVVSAGIFLLLAGWVISKTVLIYCLPGTDSGDVISGGYWGEFVRMYGVVVAGKAGISNFLLVLVRHSGICVAYAGLAIFYSIILAYRRLSCAPHDGAKGLEASREVMLGISAVFVLATVVCVASLFTVSVVGADRIYESIGRTHTKYYGYALPFVVLAGLVGAKSEVTSVGFGLRGKLLLCVISMIVFGALLVSPADLYANDAPNALVFATPFWRTASILGFLISVAISLTLHWKKASLILLGWALVMSLSNLCVYFVRDHQATSAPQRGDFLGQALTLHIPKESRDNGVVFASSVDIDLYRVMFYLNSKAPVRVVEDLREASARAETRGAEWVLLYGYPSAQIFDSACVQNIGRNVFLYWIKGAANDFLCLGESGAVGSAPSVVAKNSHPAESWGRWFSKVGYYELSKEMSGRVVVHMVALGYGPNVGRRIGVSLGNVVQEITLQKNMNEYNIIFSDVDSAKTITFSNLLDAVPAELEGGGDNRKIALGVSQLSVKVDGK